MANDKARRRGRLTLLLAAVPAVLSLAGWAHGADVRRAYIVQLTDQPVADYRGTVAGLKATKAGSGEKLDLTSLEVRQYRGYLSTKQAQARALLPQASITHQYQVVFNGFAARLTDEEVRTLKASGKALRIVPDGRQHVVTNYTPTFLGLDQPGGLWEQLGGREHAGEDVIVGIIDTGVWPENLSYADRVDPSGKPTFDEKAAQAYGAPPARWKGTCQAGEAFAATLCNNKLIGARAFDAGFRASGNTLHWSEFRSPRDSLTEPAGMGGHGTHTSSTAVGNDNVPAVTAYGKQLAVRSGIAPRARLAVYKVCWSFNAQPEGVGNTCYDSDSMAAIETAVEDGVDVLNYSISGGGSPMDPVEQAFRHAVAAGVFVAAAGGNDGPGNAVAHISPWMTTVAAATHDRTHTATLTLGNGHQYTGTSTNVSPLRAAPVIRAEDALAPGADSYLASQCYGAADVGAVQLDPKKAAGKIVACRRGDNSRTGKADAVKVAGGVGMILLDDGRGAIVEIYSVPAVHVNQADGEAVAAYAAGAGATAAMSASAMTPVVGPVMADFSSRGPNGFDGGVMKPDLAAPGVDILAGVSPALDAAGRAAVVAGTAAARSDSVFMSGTSMATPHVAGLAALLKQRHPGWSPAAMKSALMTTGRTVLPTSLTGDQDGTLPWGQGAGLVVPNGAADPGIVYDIAAADYQKYLCGVSGESAECALGDLKGHALNLPSITLPGVVGNQRVSRTVTNVGASTATYHATAAIEGFDVTVTPATLQLAPGESQTYTVDLSRTDAPHGTWKFGEIVWDDGDHKVRSPLQARFNAGVEVPVRVLATTTSGQRDLDVQTGYDGKLTAVRGGLREYTRVAQTVLQAPGALDSADKVVRACAARSPGVKAISIGIPKQTVVARFELSNRDTDGGDDDDLDLFILDQYNNLVAYSAHADSNESVTLSSPNTGIAKICVVGFKVRNGKSANFTVSYATAIPNDTKGAVQVTVPPSVKQGGSSVVGVRWSGLEQGKHYLGGLQLLNAESGAGTVTELDIDTRDVTPVGSTAAGKRLDLSQ